VEELQLQVKTVGAQLGALQTGPKTMDKAQDAGQARTKLLELQNERRNWHISHLEIILRLVENSSLKSEAVEKIKDDVEFFVGSNTVRAFIILRVLRFWYPFQEEDFDYDEKVYVDLDLDNYIEADLENESTVAAGGMLGETK